MEDSPRPVGFHPASRRVVRFAGFRADLADSSLWRDGEEVRLPPRALGVLFFLLERPGRVVSKAALLDAVWKDAHVSEASLIEAVGLLRQTLGDDAQNPRIVQTVHRRGYRLVAPIAIEQPTVELDLVRPGPGLAETPEVTAGAWELGRRRRIAGGSLWMLVVAAGAAVLAIVFWLLVDAEPARDVARVTITLPAEQAPAPSLSANPVVALSPDGRHLVYVAGSTGQYRLYIRRLDEFGAQPLPGTEDGHGPFFSPDGRHIGFFAKGRLMRISRAGGDPVLVTQTAGAGLGGTWTFGDRIVFAPGAFEGLWEVNAGGGTPRLVAAPPDEASGYRWPHAQPDGAIVATRWRSHAREAAVVLISPTGAVTELAATGSDGRVIDGRILLFVNDGTLMAARFSGAAIGTPRAVIDRLMVGATGAAQFATSGTGDLVYIPDEPERTERTIAYADQAGTLRATSLPARAYQNLAVCGRRVATTILAHGVSDLWVGDLDRGALSRLTRTGTNVEPVWRPGCQWVLFGSSRDGVLNIYEVDTNGEHLRRLQQSARIQVPTATTPDGRRLFFTEISPSTRADIWSLEDGRRASVHFAGPTAESAARVSSDGRWLAYQVDDRGSSQIFVTSVLGTGPRVPVATGGATAPSWSTDGQRLYFRPGPREIAAVDVTGTSVPVVGSPVVVLRHPDLVLFRAAPDGLLVVLRGKEHLPLTRLLLVLNWRTELIRELGDRH